MDYLWFVKENQPTLHNDVVELFEGKQETVLGGVIENDFARFRTVEKGHGRRETREVTVSSELKGYSDWPGLEQVFRLERRRIDCRIGKEQIEVAYGLTSLSREEASPERLLYLTRTHWGNRERAAREARRHLPRGPHATDTRQGWQSDGQPQQPRHQPPQPERLHQPRPSQAPMGG